MIPNQVPDDIASEIVRRFETLRKNRGNWEAQWEEIAKRILPQYAATFVGLESTPYNTGQRKTEQMVDATGALALPKFAAAMESMLTPRNSTWHRLVPMDKTLKRNRAVMMWYDEVNQRLFDYRYSPRSAFAANMHEAYMGLGAFGTACMFIDALKGPRGEKGIRYRNIHLGEVHFLENHQGIIDTAIRYFFLTPRQAYQRFGDALPQEILDKVKTPETQATPYWFIHWVGPRGDLESYDPERLDVKGMHYGSYYVSVTGKKLVQERGYNVFPYPISRYVVAPGEVYGRSPAMLVLPSIKVLNEQKKTVLTQGHRVTQPVILAHDDGVLAGFDLTPGALNFGGVNADGKPLVHVLPTGDLHLAKEMMEEERNVINDGFLVSLFQILIETPQMTATEVLERAREKGILLSPTMGRQQSEFLGPTIERELDVLSEQGLLPPMPLMLQQARAEYKAEYDSPLSRAQKAENAAGFMNTINFVRDIIAVTQDPSPMDNFDLDVAVPAVADIQAVPQSWMASPDKIAAVRQARAKAQQMQQMTEAGPSLAAVAKALPQLKLNGQSATPAA